MLADPADALSQTRSSPIFAAAKLNLGFLVQKKQLLTRYSPLPWVIMVEPAVTG
jgi:hypothetical protein